MSISSGDTDNPPILDRVREPAKLPVHVPGPGTVSEDTSDWKSTTSATPNMILFGLVESSDAYPPLKFVARCLSIILDNYEVQSPSHTFNPQYSQLN